MTALYIVLGIVLFILIVCFFGGNYLVSFSLDRESKFNLEAKAKREGWQVKRPDYSKEEAFLKNDTIVEHIFSRDGFKLTAYYADCKKKTNKFVLLIHGYGGIPEEMVPFARHYLEKGFNCLIPVMRAHGISEGRYMGMGALEKFDMFLWLDFICKKNPDAEILLHGVSMGGATVMMMSGMNLPPNVKVAVEDCGYTSIHDIFSNKLKTLFHLPSFPMIQIASLVSRMRAGYSFSKGNSLKSVSKAKIPMVFIHGQDDGFIPVEMVDKVYNACPTDKTKLIVPGANHIKSLSTAPVDYWNTVDNFIKKYI